MLLVQMANTMACFPFDEWTVSHYASSVFPNSLETTSQHVFHDGALHHRQYLDSEPCYLRCLRCD